MREMDRFLAAPWNWGSELGKKLSEGTSLVCSAKEQGPGGLKKSGNL